MCCLYAVINLLHRHGWADSVELAGEHFARILDNLPSLKWDISTFATQGVDPNEDVIELLNLAGFSALEIPPENLAEVCAINSKGILIFCKHLEGKFDHYTVVTEVSKDGELLLFDSYGFDRAIPKNGGYSLSGLIVTIQKAWKVSIV